MYLKLVISLAAMSLFFVAGCKKETTEKQAQPAPTTPAPISSAQAPAGQPKTGEALFKQNCAVCHPNGGNTINPQKTLHLKDRTANNITTPQDVVNKMRNPGPGMTKFDPSVISDDDAMKIGQYVVDTFK